MKCVKGVDYGGGSYRTIDGVRYRTGTFIDGVDGSCQDARRCQKNNCWYKWVTCFGASPFAPWGRSDPYLKELAEKYGKSEKAKLVLHQGTNCVYVACLDFIEADKPPS